MNAYTGRLLAGLKPSRHSAVIVYRRWDLCSVLTWDLPLFEVGEAPWGRHAAMPAGLEPVAVGLLGRAGYAVVRGGVPAAPLAAPAAGPGLRDRAFQEFGHATPRGVTRVGAGVRPEVLVAGLRRAFPAATIAVPAARRADVRRSGRALKSLLPAARRSPGDDFPAGPGPLVVSTYPGLAGHGVALHRRDVPACLDAREALGREPTEAIGHAARARLYGLLDRARRLAPYDRDRVLAPFGPDEVVIPRRGSVGRPAEVVTARVAGGPAFGPGADVVAPKRGAIRLSPARNRRRARLADAVAQADPGRVAAERPALAARPGGLAEPGVVSLVEGVEHALELAARLPGRPIAPGPDVVTAGLAARRRSPGAGPPVGGWPPGEHGGHVRGAGRRRAGRARRRDPGGRRRGRRGDAGGRVAYA